MVHIHQVQRLGMLVGMLVVAAASEALGASAASLAVAVDMPFPWACPLVRHSSLEDRKAHKLARMVKRSWRAGSALCCLVSALREA